MVLTDQGDESPTPLMSDLSSRNRISPTYDSLATRLNRAGSKQIRSTRIVHPTFEGLVDCFTCADEIATYHSKDYRNY